VGKMSAVGKRKAREDVNSNTYKRRCGKILIGYKISSSVPS
jgi:hypothetical protein